jgi:hypothetical protein
MAWQSAQTAKLSHLVFQLTEDQLKVVKGALSRVMPLDKEEQGGSPNARSNALFLMCQQYLENKEEDR